MPEWKFNKAISEIPKKNTLLLSHYLFVYLLTYLLTICMDSMSFNLAFCFNRTTSYGLTRKNAADQLADKRSRLRLDPSVIPNLKDRFCIAT